MVVFSSQIFLPLGKLLLYSFRKDVYLLYFAEEGAFLPSLQQGHCFAGSVSLSVY